MVHRGRLALKTEVGLNLTGSGRETGLALLFFYESEYFLLPLGKHVICVPANTIAQLLMINGPWSIIIDYPRAVVDHLQRLKTVIRSLPLAFWMVAALPVPAQFALSRQDPNEVILFVLSTMPHAGGYSASSETTRRLESAVQPRDGLTVLPELARPSYCSGATYLVFLKTLQSLNARALQTNPALVDALLIHGQPDGVGVWGRWNANGPGTACLFQELRLGRNFTSFDLARPGDFMKIFWTASVGRAEHGHSVIYLGRETNQGVEMVRFWSSNQPFGFGEKSVPRARVASAIFSRLENPENIGRAPALPLRNAYLAGLNRKDSSLMEALGQCGIYRLPGENP
jgi:hypothetical protein